MVKTTTMGKRENIEYIVDSYYQLELYKSSIYITFLGIDAFYGQTSDLEKSHQFPKLLARSFIVYYVRLDFYVELKCNSFERKIS